MFSLYSLNTQHFLLHVKLARCCLWESLEVRIKSVAFSRCTRISKLIKLYVLNMYSFLYIKKKSVALCSTWYRLEFILNKELFANSGFSQNESDLASKNAMILEITTKISTHHKCLCGSDVGSWSLILCHHHYEDHASVCN